MLFPISENLKGNDAFLRRVSMNFSLDGRRVATFTSDNPADPGSLRWIQDRMDELDVHIALRDFEDSVEGIEKGSIRFEKSADHQQSDRYLHRWIQNHTLIRLYLFIYRTKPSNLLLYYHKLLKSNHIFLNQQNDTLDYLSD